MDIIFFKSDLAWNRFSNIDENSSDEEIIKAITEYYSHEWSEVEVKIENNMIIIHVESKNWITPPEEIQWIARLAQQWQYDRARKKLKELLEKYPNDSELYRLYGQTLSDEWNLDEAEKWLIDCLKYNPENVRWLVMLWNIYNQWWKKELAKILYKRALDKNDTDIYALSNYWSLCLELWDFKEARDVLEKALKIDDEYWVTNYSLWVVEYNENNYLPAFNFALKAWENVDKRDPRTQSIMKLLVNIANAQDENLVIEALYIPFKDELEKELWKKIVFRRDDGIKSVARVKVAEYYWTDEHIVLFNPKNFWYKYSIMHELAHLKMISEARKIWKNKTIWTSYDKKQELVKYLENNSTYMQKQYESHFESYATEILQQVYNSPLDLCVENYLFNKYEGLRPSQFLFQMQLIMSAIDVAHNKDLKERVPELIYDSNIIMNSILAQQIKDLYWVDYTADFWHNDLIRTGKKLYDKFDSQKDSMQPWDEYDLVKIWAEKLGFNEYFEYDDEDLSKDVKWWVRVNDDSEDYQIEDIQAEVEKLEPDSSEINMAVVMYCLGAIRFFRTKTQKEIQFIAYELAMRWNQWIKYWEDAKYHIDSIPWKEFSWYEFLSYMYVAWQILKPEADLWLDYSREYELAKQLDSKK